jgi:hypothetical protein
MMQLVPPDTSGHHGTRHPKSESGFRVIPIPAGVAAVLESHRRRGVVGRLTPRELRHTAASSWPAAGRPIPEVAHLPGHSRPAITLAIHSRFVETESHHQAAEALLDFCASTPLCLTPDSPSGGTAGHTRDSTASGRSGRAPDSLPGRSTARRATGRATGSGRGPHRPSRRQHTTATEVNGEVNGAPQKGRIRPLPGGFPGEERVG